jgi:hypothetical protein
MSSHFFKQNQATATLPTEPVSGIATLDGQPVADATAIFAPVQVSKDIFSATGITDAPKSGPSPEDMAKMMAGNKELGGRSTGGNRGTTDSALPQKYESSSACGITFKVPGSGLDIKMTK